jgi:hypothetical protein
MEQTTQTTELTEKVETTSESSDQPITKIKLSDAMLIGNKYRWTKYSPFFYVSQMGDGKTHACALGMAFIGVGGTTDMIGGNSFYGARRLGTDTFSAFDYLKERVEVDLDSPVSNYPTLCKVIADDATYDGYDPKQVNIANWIEHYAFSHTLRQVVNKLVEAGL